MRVPRLVCTTAMPCPWMYRPCGPGVGRYAGGATCAHMLISSGTVVSVVLMVWKVWKCKLLRTALGISGLMAVPTHVAAGMQAEP